MKKFIIILLINIASTYGILYYFVLSKTVLIEEGIHISRNIIKVDSKIILDKNSVLTGDISLENGEIILKENAVITGNIILKNGSILLHKNAQIIGNIDTNGEIILEEKAKIDGNITKYSHLKKHSNSTITGQTPALFTTTNYPDFLKYFDVLPEKHKKSFGYIFVTSHNMDIRGQEKTAQEYFQNIYYYKDNTLKEVDFKNQKDLVNRLFSKADEYINIIPERNVGRFGVAFVTKNYANNKNFADMYISSSSLSPDLFLHEAGHVLDYKYSFIDYHIPTYPYPDKDSAITDYGAFHKGEDFAEAYRLYVLNYEYFQAKAKVSKEIQAKYDYLKRYVFENKEYNPM